MWQLRQFYACGLARTQVQNTMLYLRGQDEHPPAEAEEISDAENINQGETTVKISCSRCGAGEEFRYSAGNVLCAVYTKGWNSYGAALYCPECSATWNDRNKGRPMAGQENTIGLIDEFYRRSKKRYGS